MPDKGEQAQIMPQTYSSDQIFAGAREIFIDHQGDRYRLQRTSKGKLILTK
ncbi:MAG TPA: hemin uptake protein HemP [Alphaproteobacteria bacterium]|nr:hemin uptake protein HemP [Alphaproteobacteria bacterium]HAM46255.1 hemin uptake protein HemP [Alphaproteobacteria bacterium]HBA42552.1 hemin uptake protein HemP [Alphaproteobacteria bacterium]HBC53600.1 hemin uptake protein HemP [Alphaproteobacteria bacterium]HBF98847.1 hemin uptake protein HemP [Alphaproteobacteria bacterium]